MRTADFAYALPPDRVAQTPVEPRDAARLLVDRGPHEAVEHRHVRDLPELLRPGDLVVVNDTRVLPARLRLQRSSGGKVEVLLLEPLDDEQRRWEALARPAKRLRSGERLLSPDGQPVVEVGDRRAEAVEVALLGDDPVAVLHRLGEVPLPPYITAALADTERYQTVYAERPGSVAAPTAGLHLTDGVLVGLAARGIAVARVELAVGLDTFKQVTVADPADHVMHSERYRVTPEVVEACRSTRASGGRVVAVGTTSVRALESAAATGRDRGRTGLFIRRPFDWQVVDVLLTNFHLPRTSLLMLIDAFVGPRWRELYGLALAEGYRFLSFGDAMLLGATVTAPVWVAVTATDGAARSGVASTAWASYRTPCFMPVGTRGAVKLLSAADYDTLGAEIVLANTYHLMLRPGAEVVADLGGLAGFAGWSGLFLTDSGGYQVFSLDPDVDDDGVTFRSTYDGSQHRLTPEGAVATQELLGADIQMVLDVCPGLPAPEAAVRLAVERTAAWAKRARAAHERDDQALFGIVQGGVDERLRAESAQRTAELDFDGYGIGGLSVGEPREQMLPALAAALSELPAERPRYLMGVGDPVSMVEAVALGVDQFDCVMPTRLGRHGTALTGTGKAKLRNAANARSDEPIDPACRCGVCSRHSRGYLRHLFQVGDPTAARLLTLHNLAWTFALVDEMRAAIEAGRLDRLRAELSAIWG